MAIKETPAPAKGDPPDDGWWGRLALPFATVGLALVTVGLAFATDAPNRAALHIIVGAEAAVCC
jgi:hypothetical protein